MPSLSSEDLLSDVTTKGPPSYSSKMLWALKCLKFLHSNFPAYSLFGIDSLKEWLVWDIVNQHKRGKKQQ